MSSAASAGRRRLTLVPLLRVATLLICPRLLYLVAALAGSGRPVSALAGSVCSHLLVGTRLALSGRLLLGPTLAGR